MWNQEQRPIFRPHYIFMGIFHIIIDLEPILSPLPTARELNLCSQQLVSNL